jgi:hypothetical protein
MGKTMFMLMDDTPMKLKKKTAKRRKDGGQKPRYGPGVIVYLRIIWAFFGYRGEKLLAPYSGPAGLLPHVAAISYHCGYRRQVPDHKPRRHRPNPKRQPEKAHLRPYLFR